MGQKLTNVAPRDAAKALRKLGFEKTGNKGDHHVYSDGKRRAEIPQRKCRSLSENSVLLILRRAGLTRAQFLAAMNGETA